MKVREPSERQACSLTVTGSSSLSLPAASSWKTMYAVISFVRLAGSMRAVALLRRQNLVGAIVDEDVGARIDLRARSECRRGRGRGAARPVRRRGAATCR